MIEVQQLSKEQLAAKQAYQEAKIKKQVEDLYVRFKQVTEPYDPSRTARPSNVRGTKLYENQVKLAYMIHEITAGPTYIASKVLGEANKFIDQLAKEANKK